MEFLNTDAENDFATSPRVNRSNPGPGGMMGQLTLFQFLTAAQATIAAYQAKVALGKGLLAKLDVEPLSTDAAKDFALKYITVDSASKAAVPTDGVTLDGSGANGVNLPQVVQRLQRTLSAVGDQLGKYIRADLNESIREIQSMQIQLSSKYWELLGVNMSDESATMLMVLGNQSGGILGGLSGGATASPLF